MAKRHWTGLRGAVSAGLLGGCLLLGGCGGHLIDDATGSSPTSTPSPTVSATTPSAGSPSLPKLSSSPTGTLRGHPRKLDGDTVTKVLVFVVENHSLDQMRAEMPRTYALATRYGYATDYQAITHPSLPNYLTIASGDPQGVTDDDPPSDHPLQGPSIFERALQAGKTAGLYADAMPSPCATSNAGRYAVKHNPWAYFPAEAADCRKYDVPVTALAPAVSSGDLPTVGMVIPDLCHDAHDCSLATADAWIAGQVETVMSGPDWASGHLAIVITADEDDDHGVPDSDNRVLTAVLHPSQDSHVVSTRLTHRSLYGLLEDVAGVTHTEPSDTPSMAAAFGLPLLR